MKLETAQKSITNLMNKDYVVNGKTYNIVKSGWKFGGFDKAVRRLGVCRGGRKEIGLSRKMTELRSQEEVEQTILHEIAHAIDNEYRGRSGHDSVWLSISRQIGYNGQRTTKVSNSAVTKTYKWIAFCEEHGVLGGWTRKPSRGKICKRCRKSIMILPATDERVSNLLIK